MSTSAFVLRASCVVAVGALVLLVGGCASTPSTAPPADTASSVASAASSVAVAVQRDVRFATAPEPGQWTDRVMDVYAPPDASGDPLVVLFTAHGTTKDEWAQYGELAGALAQRGLVVAVSNWSQLDADQSTTAKVLRVVAEARAVQSCAVAFAVTHAAEFGADPQRLVLVGQMYGGNMTSVTALSPRVEPVSGCVERARAWQPSGLLVWDGDWMLGMDMWDSFGSDAARIASALTPWSALPTAPPVPVVLAYSDAIAQGTGRCDATTRPPWLSMRDPSGAMRRHLMSVGAFADDCIDLGDEATAMVAAMTAADIPATLLELTGATTTEESLDPADQAVLVDATVSLAAGS